MDVEYLDIDYLDEEFMELDDNEVAAPPTPPLDENILIDLPGEPISPDVSTLPLDVSQLTVISTNERLLNHPVPFRN